MKTQNPHKLSDLKLTDAERQAIGQAVELLRTQYGALEVVLFGSKARGDFDEYSDIDLLVITEQPITERTRIKIVSDIYEINFGHHVFLTTMVVWHQDWYQGIYQAMGLRDEVERDGVPL